MSSLQLAANGLNFVQPDGFLHGSNNSVVHDDYKCLHQKIIKFSEKSYCMNCGLLQGSIQTFKGVKFQFGVFFDPQKIMSAQKKKEMSVAEVLDNKNYIPIRNSVIDFLLDASSKLKFSFNTLHLGIMFMDNFMSRNHIPMELNFVYAATALMLASKIIELDMKIPFISKLKRYTKLDNPSSDFKQAELRLLKHFKWNLQRCSLIDHMETLLSMGVIFGTDQICSDNLVDFNTQHSSKLESNYGSQNRHKTYISISLLSDAKINDICHRIEKDYLRVANLVVRELQFLIWSESDKAMACILYLRKLCGIHPICPQTLQDTMVNNDVFVLLEEIVQQLDPIFIPNLSSSITPYYSSSSTTVSPTNKIHTIQTQSDQKSIQTINNVDWIAKPEVKLFFRAPLGPWNKQDMKSSVNRTTLKIPNKIIDERKQHSESKINLIQVCGSSIQQPKQNIRTPGNLNINNNHYLLRFGSGQLQFNQNNQSK